MSDPVHAVAIKNWIMAVTGFDSQHVLAGDQNGSRPNEDYAVFTFLNETGAYHSVVIPEAPEPNPTLISKWEVAQVIYPVYQIDIFSDSGKIHLNNLWNSKAVPPIRSALKASGLTLKQKSIIRNLTSLEVTSFAPRFNTDLTFVGETVFDPQAVLGWVNERWAAFDIRGEWQSGETPRSVTITDEQEY